MLGLLERVAPHKTPMLIASATPIFSLVCMWSRMIIPQGMMARTKSITPEYAGSSVSHCPSVVQARHAPLVKMLYVMITLGLQQVPLTNGCHAFSSGVHPTQKSIAVTPKSRFMETKANQMKILVLPWMPSDIISSEMPNEVLLHAAAQIVRVIEICPIRYMSLRFWNGICHTCFPYPKSMARLLHIAVPRRAT